MRNVADRAQVYGKILRLAAGPLDLDRFPSQTILPPAVYVQGQNGLPELLPGPKRFQESAIRNRVRERSKSIRQNGFLSRRPISPLLAHPARIPHERAVDLQTHLHGIWEDHQIDARFDLCAYKTVDELARRVEQGGFDAVFAVLPEHSRDPIHPNDTHEQIKRRIGVPSQCIHFDRLVPRDHSNRTWDQLEGIEPRVYRRYRQIYEVTLNSLLVKHQWFPFIPAEPFAYNVHIGIDVGGEHNTEALACLGYGFHRPDEDLFFLLEELPVAVQKREPIPQHALLEGLLHLLEVGRGHLLDVGIQPNFESVLFYRDGLLLGDGDIWNERDALEKLYNEAVGRKWITENAVWTVVEVLKAAEGWRLLRSAGEQTLNPIAGYASFPFSDPDHALVATTGAPYLTQGTAQPLLVQITRIHGDFERSAVVRDLVWGADMCFTKPDLGMSLPWVLHVADRAALQKSHAYRITGITV